VIIKDDACRLRNVGVCHTETLKNVESKVALTRCLTDPLPVHVVARLSVEATFVTEVLSFQTADMSTRPNVVVSDG
jgi:hypothetical protein